MRFYKEHHQYYAGIDLHARKMYICIIDSQENTLLHKNYDSSKIAMLMRGGMFPLAYVYPRKMRATRDLLRRRQYFVHKHSEFVGHIKNTSTQYNLPTFTRAIQCGSNRVTIPDHFSHQDESVQLSIASDLELMDA